MITATMAGRRLALTVETGEGEEPIAPFLVQPLSAREGRAMSERYLLGIEGIAPDAGTNMADILAALGKENYERADNELTQAEGELVAQAAFFWQTVGGIEAVRALLEPHDDGTQGGDVSTGKAIAVFRLRVLPLLSRIRQLLASELQTRTAGTGDTDSRPDGEKPASGPDSPPSEQQPDPSPTPSPSPDSPATTD